MEEKEQLKEKQNSKGAILPGMILIILGLAFFLPQLGIGESGDLWPAFILAPGLGFLALYFASDNRKKVAGLLIPGVITTLVSIFFFVLNYAGWQHMATLWPMFPLFVGISFYAFYLGSGRQDRGILIPANILLLVGVVFLALSSYSYKFWPIVLIGLGLIMIFFGKKDKQEEEEKN